MNEDLEIFTLTSHFWQSHKKREIRGIKIIKHERLVAMVNKSVFYRYFGEHIKKKRQNREVYPDSLSPKSEPAQNLSYNSHIVRNNVKFAYTVLGLHIFWIMSH